jgi:acetyl esterase
MAEVPLGDAGPPDLAALRAGYLETAERLGGAAEEVARVEDVVIPREDGTSLMARAYWPRVAASPGGVVVWFHGGGWCIGDIEGFDRVSRSLANAAGHVVLSVDYRLAPEAPFPAATDDAHFALAWVRGPGAQQLGTDPERVVSGGDSAGGHLAAVAALSAGREAVALQLLVYPALDPEMDSDAYREYADGPMLSAAEMRACWTAYLGAAETAQPDCAILNEDLRGAPPAAIAIAGHDPLRDDGLRYAQRLQEAGGEADVEVYEDMVHGFLRWGGAVDRSRELIGWLGERARAALA